MLDLFHDQPNVTVHRATVTAVDLENREIHLSDLDPLPDDYLVMALGAQVNFFDTEGAGENAFPMYTLSDAVRVREHVLRKWEAADNDHAVLDDGALNVVVVGGGPTGVESAAALALYRNVFSEDYRGLPQEQARIMLIEAAPELFTMFKPKLRCSRRYPHLGEPVSRLTRSSTHWEPNSRRATASSWVTS
jgi:NADH dehydrogenase